MISSEEWMRTEDHENYLITDEILTSENISYNSADCVMPEEDVYVFLKLCNVV